MGNDSVSPVNTIRAVPFAICPLAPYSGYMRTYLYIGYSYQYSGVITFLPHPPPASTRQNVLLRHSLSYRNAEIETSTCTVIAKANSFPSLSGKGVERGSKWNGGEWSGVRGGGLGEWKEEGNFGGTPYDSLLSWIWPRKYERKTER